MQTNMNEKEFLDLADATMQALENAIEAAADMSDADIDIEPQPGGILQLSFDNGSRIIINRHLAAREIWVAAKSGGFHYRPLEGRWIGTRDSEDLYAALSRVISEQAECSISLPA